MFKGSASKQEQVQEVTAVFGAPVCSVQLMPAAHCGGLGARDLVPERSAVDKAKSFKRIPFTFPLEEFILIVFENRLYPKGLSFLSTVHPQHQTLQRMGCVVG